MTYVTEGKTGKFSNFFARRTRKGSFNKRATPCSQVDAPGRLGWRRGAPFPGGVGEVWVPLGTAPAPSCGQPVRGLSRQNRNYEAGGVPYSPPRVPARLIVFLLVICFSKTSTPPSLNKSDREDVWKQVTSL